MNTEDQQKPLPPYSGLNPSMGERTKQEIWNEYMDFKEAVWDYFLYGQAQLKGEQDYKDWIYSRHDQLRRINLSSDLRARLEGGLSIPKEYEKYVNPYPREIDETSRGSTDDLL